MDELKAVESDVGLKKPVDGRVVEFDDELEVDLSVETDNDTDDGELLFSDGFSRMIIFNLDDCIVSSFSCSASFFLIFC